MRRRNRPGAVDSAMPAVSTCNAPGFPAEELTWMLTRGYWSRNRRGPREQEPQSEGRETMTKQDIVEDIALRTGLTKKEVAEAVELFLKEIGHALARGQHLEIRGFGTFKVKQRKERMARNPRTGDAVPVPARKVPVFKVSKMLKDRVALS